MSFLKRTPGESKEERPEERKVEIDKPPAPKLIEEQRPMLDWLKEADKKKITALIHAYFDDGVTNGNDVYARLTSPDRETGVKSITPRIISGLYGMWQRWKSPETQRSKEDEEVMDKKMRELEARLISRFDKALSKLSEKEIEESEEPAEDEDSDSEIDSDTKAYVKKRIEESSHDLLNRVKPDDKKTEEPSPDEERLQKFKEALKKQERDLANTTEELEIAQKSSTTMKKRAEKQKVLDRERQKIDKIRDQVSQDDVPAEEIPDMELQEDVVLSDCLHVMKWCKIVMRESFDNILEQYGGRSRATIEKKLEVIE